MAYGEDGLVWENILTQLPFTRGKRLWHNVWKDLEAVYKSGTIHQMRAAQDYTTLRYNFFSYLEDNRRNLRHINAYEMHLAHTWNRRISDKLAATKRGRVKKDGGWQKDRVPRKVSHPWVN